jgi:uncharacterized protein
MFFAVFFTVYGLINYYIFLRGLQSIPPDSRFGKTYIILFWIIVLSYPGGRLLERIHHSIFSTILIWIGSFWIAAMLYFFISVFLLDLLRSINHFFHFSPAVITRNYQQTKFITAIIVTILTGFALLIGHINSIFPQVKTLNLTIAKKSSPLSSLTIAVVSDVHLGTIVGRSRLDRIVNEINSLNPDLVLLPGDIVDEDLTPVIRQNLGESFRNIKSRFGVFAATGNHEYIGGVDKASSYLVEHKVIVLRDQAVKVADSFYLVGREDRSISRFSEMRRKNLSELMEQVDRDLPVVLMDHQPFELGEAAAQGIDLQISGHTHNGQIWPINYIVKLIYEVPWGYKKIGNTHFYVSDGVGTWGPPVRLGNRPEIVNILINFK